MIERISEAEELLIPAWPELEAMARHEDRLIFLQEIYEEHAQDIYDRQQRVARMNRRRHGDKQPLVTAEQVAKQPGISPKSFWVAISLALLTAVALMWKLGMLS